MSRRKISRRRFLEGTGTALAAVAAAPALAGQRAPAATAAPGAAVARGGGRTTIRVTVNGVPRQVEVEDRWTLVELLRDHLQLTGTKIGCDRGECGACTVLLDGKPVYSCSQLAVWADGGAVQTVEGLIQNGRLDPLQQAFVDHDAPQCGFCTSGQLMSAKALVTAHPRPTADQVRAALTGNLCRCSNYNHYVEAVLAGAGVAPSGPAENVALQVGEAGATRTLSGVARAFLASDSPDVARAFGSSGSSDLKTVGHATPRIDAVDRATGKAAYTGDIRLPGMLYARILRSPHAHARIRRIDTSKALALPGVKAIVTRENCEVVWGAGGVAGGQQYNDEVKKITKQRRYAFNNPVRFVGEPVAAVAAIDRHSAEEALHLIDVDYEALAFVLDQEAALKPGAPQIWPDGNLSLNNRNEAVPITQKRGDVDAGFRAADQVFEGRFTTAFVHNAQMEPRSALASWDGDKLTIYTPTQGISNCRTDMARDLGIPPEKVQVVCHYMGGGFGNKNQNQDADLIAAVLARDAKAPVKLELSRKEDFIGVHGRWPTTQYYKVGVKSDGTLTAIQLRGYSGMGPYRKNSGGLAGIELYQCPNSESVVHPVYTNKTVSGNFRGPEYPQGFFGIQSMMDDVAAKLKMDPVDFIRKNMTRKFRDETPYTTYTLDECIRRGVEAFDWKKKWHPPGAESAPIKRGVGVAFMAFRSGLGRSSAVIRLDSKGRYAVHVGVTDVGSGAKTTMGLIAAEALDVPLSKVDVVWGDTDRCPYSVGESGSRTTIMTGHAVVEAARDLRRQIADKGGPKGDDVLIASATPNPTLEGRARSAFGAHFVEVEVDTGLGRVRIVKYLAVHDCGRLINPLTAASQIKGGATMGIGMALHEDLLYDRRSGAPLTAGYYGARILTHRDAPEIDVIFLESDDGLGPFGAKSMGESSKVPAVAAVGNAVFNAIGRRMRDLPITRDKIITELARTGGTA
jgi:CO/xanthine dehydrogenase Mo-binding subunit/aerobic-type carbon monoxide dehydrogenase small subunit (CoxS/CutS family)